MMVRNILIINYIFYERYFRTGKRVFYQETFVFLTDT